ncbi:hypothetical protein T439DRAFT_381145 [Meredithblackwellia eburnea MCA 4105]
MPSRMNDSDDEYDEDAPSAYIYWVTKPLLPQQPAKPSATTTASSSKSRPPVAPPILVAQTPVKGKRDTTAARLPSPSTSSSTVSQQKKGSVATRMSKRRRPAQVQKEEVVDESTLRTLGVLAARLNSRSLSVAASSASRTPGISGGRRSSAPPMSVGKSPLPPSVVSKGKGKEVDVRTPTVSTLPTPGRSASTSSNRALTNGRYSLVAAKPSLSSTSASGSASHTTSASTPSHNAPSSLKLNSAPVPASKPKSVTTNNELEPDEFDDASFELALSQMDDFEIPQSQLPHVLVPPTPDLSKSLPAKKGAPTTAHPSTNVALTKARHLQQGTPVRSSPRFSGPSKTTGTSIVSPAVLKGKDSNSSRGLSDVHLVESAKRKAGFTFRGKPPALNPVKSTLNVKGGSKPSPAVVSSCVIAAAVGSIKVCGVLGEGKAAEAVQLEVASLLEGAADWSDDDFY